MRSVEDLNLLLGLIFFDCAVGDRDHDWGY